MKVVTIRDFRDRATEVLRSDEPVLITRGGLPAGFFVPWDTPDLPDDLRNTVFLRLTDMIREEREHLGVGEGETIGDFAAWRRRR